MKNTYVSGRQKIYMYINIIIPKIIWTCWDKDDIPIYTRLFKYLEILFLKEDIDYPKIYVLLFII